LVPLLVNQEQADVLYWIGMQLASGVPPRIQILKARRMGISTLAIGLATFLTRNKPNYSAFACAHDAKGTDTLSAMARRFLLPQNMPNAASLPLDIDSREALVYSAPHSSSVKFQTAGSESGIGRSQEITFLHVSEKAFISNWSEVAKALMACVPDNNPLSMVIEESTANGQSGPFYEDWKKWVEYRKKYPYSLDGKLCLFFSWLEFPAYKRSVPEDYDWGKYDEVEQKLVKLGATPEQLYWRRCVIAEKYNGDEDSFAQEFPAWPEQAFIASGSQVFPYSTIDYHRNLEKPGERFILEWDHDGKVRAVPGNWDDNYWEVWYPPEKGRAYCIGADTATGKYEETGKREPDAHAAFVLDRQDFCQAARWNGAHIDEMELGRELHKCAVWYNSAWVAPEINFGRAAMLVLKEAGYNNIYRQKMLPESTREGQEQGEYGWVTDQRTRPLMISYYLDRTCRNADGRFDGKLKVFSKLLVDQESTFVKKKSGKAEHQDGEHDDELFGAMIAVWMDRVCPMTLNRSDYTPGPIVGKRIYGYTMMGGVDDRRLQDSGDDDETT